MIKASIVRLTGIFLLISIHYSAAKYNLHNIQNQFHIYNGNLEYHAPVASEFPIIALHPCIKDWEPSLNDFKGVKECGFNTAIYTVRTNLVDSVCSLAEKYGLKLILGKDILTKKNGKTYIEEFKHIPTISGWYLKDEPKYETLDSLKKLYNSILKIDSTRLLRINLIGTLYSPYTGETESMISYLDTIQRLFRPGVWSYDLYPICIKNGKTDVLYDLFYSDLEVFHKVSKITNRPFWTHCQSMAFKNKYKECPPATVPFLRFQNFSALAYGCQGIIYWSYSQRQSGKSEDYLSALVNLDGKRTPAWYAAQEVNKEIKLFSHIFLNCEVKEIRHSGKKIYKDTKPFKGSFGPIDSVKNGDSGFLFSNLTKKENDYIIIVNRDPIHSQEITVYFNQSSSPICLKPIKTNTGLAIKKENLNAKLKELVEPGAYLIIKY